MRKQAAEGWARFNAEEQLADLERELSGELISRAASPEKLRLAEPEARKAVERFARGWLAAAKDLPPSSVVDVTFRDRGEAKAR
jgi:hypothetical protein